jgi:hypothetical protein
VFYDTLVTGKKAHAEAYEDMKGGPQFRGLCMKRLLVAALIAAIIVSFNFAVAHADDSSKTTPAKSSGDWKLLFNGENLDGWRGFKSAAPGKGWKITNGELTTPGHAGDLISVEEFGDFELSLEWKVGKGSNSGIIYRVGMNEAATYETGPEYQLLDNVNSKENDGLHSAGSMYDVIAPLKDYTRPTGEWNETRIVVRGWKIEHWLNGEKIVDVDLASPEGQQLVSKSKFRLMPKFATLSRGHIALQDHGDLVSFRRIKIREAN